MSEHKLFFGKCLRRVRAAVGLAVLMTAAAAAECAAAEPSAGPAFSQTRNLDDPDGHGRVYYIDGAGNWGYGVKDVPAGLREAGYRGRVVNFRWSPFRDPALDQTIGRKAARRKGQQLAREIEAYARAYPGRPVDVMALSAGTGVAVWACESLQSARVRNMIVLGSSLSSAYDLRSALANVDGHMYVYHSHRDAVLKYLVPASGTIDGRHRVKSAGQVGFRLTSGATDKIRNIAWSPQHAADGWDGSHTEATSAAFVAKVLAKHIVEDAAATPAFASASDHASGERGPG